MRISFINGYSVVKLKVPVTCLLILLYIVVIDFGLRRLRYFLLLRGLGRDFRFGVMAADIFLTTW